MRILFVSSEVYPYSKTGGLGDVAGALPEALVREGHEVLVVSPWYKTHKGQKPLWIGDVMVPFDDGDMSVGVGELTKNGVRYAFVGHSDFNRDSLYGFEDDGKRFARFTRAVPQVAERVNFYPDVVHANDWHTGYLPMLLEYGWQLPPGFVRLGTVYTLHNVQYQGHSSLDDPLNWLRLPYWLRDSWMNYFGGANAMQAGVGFASHVTTVSPTYAGEIQGDLGYGLDGTFRSIDWKLSGIVNGLDTDVWNPATDSYLGDNYSALDLSGKAAEKSTLCERFGLDSAQPLVGVVSRLVDQKGIDLVLNAIYRLVEQGWNVMILGSGDAVLEGMIHEATSSRPGNVGSYVGYDEGFAHHIYAGADALLVPSRFEPCGLNQMIAMRYGTLPIARATGGLRDTIEHWRTGFLFDHPTSDGVLWACHEALKTYYQGDHWRYMVQQAMAEDFSWQRSAKAYGQIYEMVKRS